MDMINVFKFPLSAWRANRIKRTIRVIIDQVHKSADKPLDKYKIRIHYGFNKMSFELIGGSNDTLEIFNACIRIINASKEQFDFE